MESAKERSSSIFCNDPLDSNLREHYFSDRGANEVWERIRSSRHGGEMMVTHGTTRILMPDLVRLSV